MKKVLLILLIVVILLGGGFSYLYFNPQLSLSQKVLSIVEIKTATGELDQISNPASVFCKQNSGTLEIITDLSGGQSGLCHLPDGNICEEWAYMNGECKAGKDPSGSKDSNDPMYALIKDSNTYGNCSVKIGDIEQIKNDIRMKTGGIIESLIIKDSCGETREYSSKPENYKETPRKIENFIQENDKYIIYSLIDTNRDIYTIEYPVIIYDKKNQTNTLFTIRLQIPRFEYLDSEGNIIIAGGNEGGPIRVVFNIPSNTILGEYNSPWLDCGDQSLARDEEKNIIILHNFNEGSCGYDSEGVNVNQEKALIGKLTYKNSMEPLGTFNKGSKLHATNEDIIESVKGNTFIFHIDNTKYELSNNQLIKK